MRLWNHKAWLATGLALLWLVLITPSALADQPPAGTSSPDPGQATPAASVPSQAAPVPPEPTAPSQAVPASPQATTQSQPTAAPPQTPDPSPATEAPPATPATQPPDPTSTQQTIWQVQNLGCLSHCHDDSQTQSAQQVNVTVQTVAPSSQAVQPAATPEPQTGGQTDVKQIQLGCLSHCFGSTTVTSDPDGTLKRLANADPPKLPDLSSQPAAKSTVSQSSYQVQVGAGPTGTQSQSAGQASVSLPPADPEAAMQALPSELGSEADSAASALAGWLGSVAALPGSSGAPAPFPTATTNVVNQVEQAIWQLQLGCLTFCTGTQQTQQAEESNTTVLLTSGPVDARSPVASGNTFQLIWQLQIGCLFYCYDAVQTQIASVFSDIETVVVPSPPGGGSPPPPSGGPPTSELPSPVAGAEAAPPTPAPVALPAPALISSPPPGLISSGSGFAEISGPLRRPDRPNGLTAPLAALPRLPVEAGPAASPPPENAAALIATNPAASASPAGLTQPATSSTQARHLRRGVRAHRSASAPSRPALQATHDPPGLSALVFLALLSLIALALVGPDLRKRWLRRRAD